MVKKLVAYFSATGVTAHVAESLSEAIIADIFEIRPKELYSKEDLNWWVKESRSTLEMNDPACRPLLAGHRDNMDEYDVIFVGFPIWWNKAPRVINTFLEDYDFTGKIIVPFATSGGSSIDKINESIQNSCKDAVLKNATLISKDASFVELSHWADAIMK